LNLFTFLVTRNAKHLRVAKENDDETLLGNILHWLTGF